MRKSKSALFLMELIIVIFFFALTSAVCLQLFVKAHTFDRRTQGLNYATLWADNAAELFYEYGSDPNVITSINEDFSSTVPYHNQYTLSIVFSEDNDFEYMEYSFSDNSSKETLYSVTLKKHKKEVAD